MRIAARIGPGLLLAVCLWSSLHGAAAAVEQRAPGVVPPMADTSAGERRALIAKELHLSTEEAARFWPVYQRFERDLEAWRERRSRIVAEFGANFDDMSDAMARKLTLERLELDEARCRLMRRYFPQFSGVLPARKLARYYDIEAKIRAAVNAEIAEGIPLTE